MRYIALTEAVAAWLLGKAGLIDAVFASLVRDPAKWELQIDDEFVEGPFRIARGGAGNVIGIWNADYLSGTGDESWGFIRVEGGLSLTENLGVGRETFERCLYVISQRLQGLMIDGAFFPRGYDGGIHTCLAGRGSDARHLSISYFEGVVSGTSQKQQAVICVGPSDNWAILQDGAIKAGRELPMLVEKANILLSSNRQTRIAPSESLTSIRDYLKPFTRADTKAGIGDVEVEVRTSDIDDVAKFNAGGLTYPRWIASDSSLTAVQRRILMSDAVEQHPIRIIGPGGSGKTLLMQLLAVRRLRLAEERLEKVRIIYLVHNQAMAQMVRQRFDVLTSDQILRSPSESSIEVKTLSEVARQLLEIEDVHVVNTDAHEAKLFQFDEVRKAILGELEEGGVSGSKLFAAAAGDDHLISVLSYLIMSEISIAIKGQGLAHDKKRYVQSERRLSRFHGALNGDERNFIFRVFERYHREVFESLEVLDSDDLAISLLGRMRTPIWDLRRRQQGYDFVFVDETQLFNENERRIIPLLSNSLRKYVPVVLALDEAQSVYGLTSAGFATLGIEGIANESLASIHRSTKSIIELAFFVIQRSTDLFGADFPDFTSIADRIEDDSHPLAVKPRLERAISETQEFGRFILKRVRELRKANLRQICVIVHADIYWDAVLQELSSSDLPLQVMLTRGQRLPIDQPLVVLTKPAYVGGQEFDAAILVGLEQGVVPPKVEGSETLSTAVEQQVIREIYLSLTRARYRVVVVLSKGAEPTSVLADASKHGLLL